MQTIKALLFPAFCLAAATYTIHAQTLPPDYIEAVNKWIEADNNRTKPKAAPYAEIDDSVAIYIGDLDADGDEDAVADYNVTFGGNAVTEYLTVFLNNNGKLSKGYKREVGGTGSSMLDSIAIQNGAIVCTTVIWRRDDAQCCPSGNGIVRYVFRKGRLKRA